MTTVLTVRGAFWTGSTARAIRQLANHKEVRILACYLITGPAANPYGLYCLSLEMARIETNLSHEELAGAFAVLVFSFTSFLVSRSNMKQAITATAPLYDYQVSIKELVCASLLQGANRPAAHTSPSHPPRESNLQPFSEKLFCAIVFKP